MKNNPLKKGAIISGSILLIATLLGVILLSDLGGKSRNGSQFALILILFTFLPLIIVSLVTFIIFIYRLKTDNINKKEK